MLEREFNGTYGASKTKCTIFTYGNWYVVEGSKNVNLAASSDSLFEGMDVEEISDVDCFTWNEPIKSIEELVEAVEG